MTMNAVVIFFFFFFFRFTQKSTSQGTADSFYYDACSPSMCGNVAVSFPFSSSEAFCRLPDFVIVCNASSSLATITLSGRPYRVNQIYYGEHELLLTVSDHELASQIRSNSCSAAGGGGGGGVGGGGGLRGHFLPESTFSPFRPFDGYAFLNFTWCDRGRVPPNSVNLLADCPGRNNASGSLSLLPPGEPLNNDSELPADCDHATLPVLQLNLQGKDVTRRDDLCTAIDQGFALVSAEWDKNFAACSNCQAAGGRCGYNQSSGEPRCFCRETCGRGKDDNKFPWKIIVAIVTPTTILSAAGLIALVKFRSSLLRLLVEPSSHNSTVVKEFISTYKSTLTTEYSYSDLRRIIGGTKEKLGEGGYGNVYKGKLQNGLPVAVKILEKSKDDGQDFMNEVGTVGKIHHANIIRLLGFCCDGPHRALIYELMDKGSLAKLISNEETKHAVDAQRLLDIALGIARGVEYLHNGCERRILHLDIKPHNVLLDSNFEPELSDFGLAKLQSRKESAVTLTGGGRGTIGYIAPEVFMRSLGGVSHKSDVYSFGMLLLEMASGRKKITRSVSMQEVDVGVGSSDEYFPDRIYEQLREWQGLDVVGHVEVEVEENLIRRKFVMVGLWCIQTDPVSRPSIGRAIEILRGEVERIEMPPKPLLFSSPIDRQQSGHGSQTSYFSIDCSLILEPA